MTANNYRVIWSRAAQERLGDIHFWHTLDYNERRADKVVSSIEAAVDEIRRFPFSAPVFQELDVIEDTIRVKVVERAYKIVYRIESEVIGIIDILHTAQDAASAINKE